jgi:hypothetical protein
MLFPSANQQKMDCSNSLSRPPHDPGRDAAIMLERYFYDIDILDWSCLIHTRTLSQRLSVLIWTITCKTSIQNSPGIPLAGLVAGGVGCS